MAQMPTNQYALAADLGGTAIRVALVDRQGRAFHRYATPTMAHQGRECVLDRLVGALRRVAAHADRDSLVGVSLCAPGPVDPDTGVVYNPPNLPGWDGYNAKPVLEEDLSLKATIANDATLAALAEHVHGAGRGYRYMVYVTLSTGIGGGVILDGRLYTGARGFAGEIGHMTIDRNGPVCKCGNVGCLEALASGTAVARMACERLASGEPSSLLERACGDPDKVDARMVAEAARSGDKTAQGIVREVASNLGHGMVSIIHAFDPEVIVVGGGMSRSLDLLLPGIVRQIERHALTARQGRVPVVKSELGDDVSLLGAAALAFDTHERGD